MARENRRPSLSPSRRVCTRSACSYPSPTAILLACEPLVHRASDARPVRLESAPPEEDRRGALAHVVEQVRGARAQRRAAARRVAVSDAAPPNEAKLRTVAARRIQKLFRTSVLHICRQRPQHAVRVREAFLHASQVDGQAAAITHTQAESYYTSKCLFHSASCSGVTASCRTTSGDDPDLHPHPDSFVFCSGDQFGALECDACNNFLSRRSPSAINVVVYVELRSHARSNAPSNGSLASTPKAFYISSSKTLEADDDDVADEDHDVVEVTEPLLFCFKLKFSFCV